MKLVRDSSPWIKLASEKKDLQMDCVNAAYEVVRRAIATYRVVDGECCYSGYPSSVNPNPRRRSELGTESAQGLSPGCLQNMGNQSGEEQLENSCAPNLAQLDELEAEMKSM